MEVVEEENMDIQVTMVTAVTKNMQILITTLTSSHLTLIGEMYVNANFTITPIHTLQAGYYRPRGSYGGGRPASRGGGLKRGGSRGVKRTGGDFGGPNPKKMHDFSSDITF